MKNLEKKIAGREVYHIVGSGKTKGAFDWFFKVRDRYETFLDVGSGLILSTLIQLLIFPFFDLHPTVWESFNIAIIFTIISMIRSWIWRTIFTRRRINDNRNKRLQGIR